MWVLNVTLNRLNFKVGFPDPILFILYVNSIGDCKFVCLVAAYAHGTCFLFSDNTRDRMHFF